MARRHALFSGRHALFPSAMRFFSAMRSKCALTQMLSRQPRRYLSWPRRYTFRCMVFSHRWVHTFSVHQCTGRPIRSGVINWLVVIKNQVDSVACQQVKRRQFNCLHRVVYTVVQTDAPLLITIRFMCIYLSDFKLSAQVLPWCKIKHFQLEFVGLKVLQYIGKQLTYMVHCIWAI